MAIQQSQSIKLAQKLTYHQIQLINIVGLPTVALEQYIANEIAINPALELDTVENEIEHTEDSDEESNEIEINEDQISEGKLGEDYDYQDYMDRDSLDDYKYEANNHVKEDEKREQVFFRKSRFYSAS